MIKEIIEFYKTTINPIEALIEWLVQILVYILQKLAKFWIIVFFLLISCFCCCSIFCCVGLIYLIIRKGILTFNFTERKFKFNFFNLFKKNNNNNDKKKKDSKKNKKDEKIEKIEENENTIELNEEEEEPKIVQNNNESEDSNFLV
eukprot:EC825646.1.p1 GENE.EC825646.1~~EC825646.1.p1  ORF type:complete len:146 (+),score=49.59 EC825646.1:288-725(+)